jgi:predicted membrane-bound spermidine synthase
MVVEKTVNRAAAFLLATVAGAAVMVVELAAGRMLTPVFGGSIEVWAVVIAVTMAALAAGYALGGSLADSRGGTTVAYRAAAFGALMIALMPLARAPILKLFADLSTASGSLGAALFLLFPPLMSLGMVSPALVRSVASTDSVGRATGRIYAISTVGSMVGALLAGLVLLPSWPASWVLFGTAGVLALAVVPGSARVGVAAVLVAGSLAGWRALAPPPLPSVTPDHGPPLEVVARVPSPFGEVRVVERGSHRIMLTNGIDQGGIDIRTKKSAYGYSRNLVALIPAYLRRPAQRVLLIGLGPGVVSTDLRARGMHVDSVEIDPAVVQVAREWFDFDGPVVVEDGRRMLRLSDDKWDVLIVDAYLSGNPPSHLFTVEAFEDYQRHLEPGGLVILNVVGNPDDPRQRPALDAVLATANAVFETAEAWPDRGQSADYPIRNIYVVATDVAGDRDAPISAGTGSILSDAGQSIQPLLAVTARHVRLHGAKYLPIEIRVD